MKGIALEIKESSDHHMECNIVLAHSDGTVSDINITSSRPNNKPPLNEREFVLHAIADALGFNPPKVLNLDICNTADKVNDANFIPCRISIEMLSDLRGMLSTQEEIHTEDEETQERSQT